jgi:hypothetical protein
VVDLQRLDQRQRLEELVHRPEAAREDHERLDAYFTSITLRHEEVVEVQLQRLVLGSGSCSSGSSMLRPTDSPLRLAKAPRFAASMIPGPPPVITAVAGLRRRSPPDPAPIS